jgi:hypothetical protein
MGSVLTRGLLLELSTGQPVTDLRVFTSEASLSIFLIRFFQGLLNGPEGRAGMHPIWSQKTTGSNLDNILGQDN